MHILPHAECILPSVLFILAMQSQMKGLQSRMSSLGQQINDMYKRAENSDELAVASLTARLHSQV